MLVYCKCFLCFILFFVTALCAEAQEISFKDSIKLYNDQRIKINKTGMEVQGVWGIASIAEGGIGYFGSRGGEGKYFSEMNGIFGVINIGLAAAGLHMLKKQLAHKMSYEESYNWYVTDKRIYLVGEALDLIIIGGGLGLNAYGSSAKSNADVYKGFGKSLTLQGIFLLLFDNVMLLEHQRNGNKWYRIMDELRVTNNGVGFVHVFNSKFTVKR